MKNKKLIIILISLLIILSIGIYFVFNKSINTNNTSVTSIIKSEIENIDWSSYDSEEITLTKSVEITKEGVYQLTGTITDGYIYISTDGNVKLILNNVTITNSSGPAIYVENAKNVEISTVSDTSNTLTDGASYKNYDEDVNGCIFSKDDLILSGEGTLKVIGNYEDGIVSKDDLEITSGTYIIDAKNNGIKGKDSVTIENGTFTISSLGDAIVATNDTDDTKGYILINNGNFNIKTTGNTNSVSAKGIKAVTQIEINGGTFEINTTDDGIHTDGNIVINNGNITINSKDDGIHADGLIEIDNGTFNITAAEGIEATYVKINDGNIDISASDDGINAGRKSTNYEVTIEINGGNITIKMGQGDTDGIDSNGNIYINGGTVNITGQSPFDYDGEAKYTGCTIIVNGEKTNTITNQFMGGGMAQGMPQDRNMDQGNGGRRMR